MGSLGRNAATNRVFSFIDPKRCRGLTDSGSPSSVRIYHSLLAFGVTLVLLFDCTDIFELGISRS